MAATLASYRCVPGGRIDLDQIGFPDGALLDKVLRAGADGPPRDVLGGCIGVAGQASDDLVARIASFLDAHHVVSLATSGPEGAHAANLFFACDGLALIWVSDPGSRHSSHIALDARVAATIAPDYCDFPEIKGLQLSGCARPISDDAECARARDLMQARYAFLRTALAAGSPLRAAYERARFYRLDPTRIVLIDNSRGFGSKEVLDLGERA
jgi:uncharacterized protein YhbP (UPF0306 family)